MAINNNVYADDMEEDFDLRLQIIRDEDYLNCGWYWFSGCSQNQLKCCSLHPFLLDIDGCNNIFAQRYSWKTLKHRWIVDGTATCKNTFAQKNSWRPQTPLNCKCTHLYHFNCLWNWKLQEHICWETSFTRSLPQAPLITSSQASELR